MRNDRANCAIIVQFPEAIGLCCLLMKVRVSPHRNISIARTGNDVMAVPVSVVIHIEAQALRSLSLSTSTSTQDAVKPTGIVDEDAVRVAFGHV